MTQAIVPGLCSVTFRALGVDAIVDLAHRAELGAIEWGADVHVPPGDLVQAEHVRNLCAAAGLLCRSYGSYWFAGQSTDDDLVRLLDTANVIGATTVRVWAPGDPHPQNWADGAIAVDALKAACDRAAERQLDIAVEFHPDTLTETAASTCHLLESVDRTNLRTYWQPRPGVTGRAALDELERVLGSLEHLHVFAWDLDSRRLPLAAHEDSWRQAISLVESRAFRRPICAYLEFVQDDEPAALLRDAVTLRSWIAE